MIGEEIWAVLRGKFQSRNARLEELARKIDRHTEQIAELQKHTGLAGAIDDIAGRLRG